MSSPLSYVRIYVHTYSLFLASILLAGRVNEEGYNKGKDTTRRRGEATSDEARAIDSKVVFTVPSRAASTTPWVAS